MAWVGPVSLRVRRMTLLFAAVVLLCAAAPALGRENCNTTIDQATWLSQNTNFSTCFAPLITLQQSNGNFSTTNARNVELVCTDDCGGAFFQWLTSDECEGRSVAALVAFSLSDIICANSSGSAESSCLFSNSSGRVDDALIEGLLQACSDLFLSPQQCPTDCSGMLRTAVERIGCCYNNFYGTEIAVEIITEQFRNFLNESGAPIFDTLPTNFTVNITDSDLLEACNVTNPGRCESAYAHITLRKGAGVVMTASLAVLVASVLSALTVH